jgi:8-oxo-dGTP pyrophosphatase MutT (NUDIX family)
MEKFSRIKPESNYQINGNVKKTQILYSDDYIEIVKYEDWTIQKGKDFVICIPVLLEQNKFVIREEYIPPFKMVEGQERHLACVGGQIEDGETPESALLREIEEEAGLVIRDTYQIDFMKPLFINKSSSIKCHMAILPLSESDYHEVEIKGDGTKWEKMSKTIYLDTKYINSLYTSDIITEFMLIQLKKYMNIE